jgi:hypothetical protein
MQITPDSIVIAADNQVSCEVDDEAALLNLQTGVYYGLDPMGAYIWRLLAAPISVRALQEQIVREFDADADVVARDVVDFLTEMQSAGLVEVKSTGTGAS